MAAHHDLIKRLQEDEELRAAIVAAPTREAKQALVRDAGLEVPDHHDVLQHVAGGDFDSDAAGSAAITGVVVGFAAGAAAAAV